MGNHKGSRKNNNRWKSSRLQNRDTIRIPKYAKHRIQSGNTETVFIEIQTGEYFGEDDIVRIEDDYNRLNEK